MANQQHVDMLIRDGVHAWNRWRKEEPGVRPDLYRADLHGANLYKANLFKADLPDANLSGADLRGADLLEADLNRANLRGADLRGADFHGARFCMADLSGANLRRAFLLEADLSNADLHEADLSWAHLGSADLYKANLRGAHLRGVNLRNADLHEANLSEADLYKANLRGATCVRTRFSNATLTSCKVYGISAWDVKLDGAIQADLLITPEGQKVNISVDNLEVAQFLYVLLNNQKVRSVLDVITSKLVLILGRFSTERKPVLDAVRDALRRHPNGYIPVLFDFEPQHDKPVLETVKTLANLARFVIADLTDPNMVRSELTYITANVPTVPVQPVILNGASLPTEYGTWRRYNTFLPIYRYDDLPHLLANLTEAVIEPVEAHVVGRSLADADNA